MNVLRVYCLFGGLAAGLYVPALAQGATKPLPVPVADGVYASHCGDLERDDEQARRASLTLSGKTAEVYWADGGATEEFTCKILTRSTLTASQDLPRGEVLELNCTNNGEEAENLLYLRSWSVRESELSAWSAGNLTVLFVHRHWSSKPRIRADELLLAKCVEP